MPIRSIVAGTWARIRPTFSATEDRHLIVKAAVVGVVVWSAVYSLKWLVHETFLRIMLWVDGAPSPLLVFVPLLAGSGAAAALIWYHHSTVHYLRPDGRLHALIDAESDGLERAIALYDASEPSLEKALLGKQGVDVRWELPTASLAARKYLATWLTLGTGGSGGLEGSVALVGESAAAMLFKPRHVHLHGWAAKLRGGWRAANPDELQTLQLCGISAALSTLLGAPFAASFFAIEVMYRRRPMLEKLTYTLIAALVSFFLSHFVSGGHERFLTPVGGFRAPMDVRYYAAVLVLCLGVVAVSASFGTLRKRASIFFHAYFPRIWMRHAVGAILTGIFALGAAALSGAGLQLTLSTGQDVVQQALVGQIGVQVALVAVVAKLLTTVSTVGSGGSAGLLIPAVYLEPW